MPPEDAHTSSFVSGEKVRVREDHTVDWGLVF